MKVHTRGAWRRVRPAGAHVGASKKARDQYLAMRRLAASTSRCHAVLNLAVMPTPCTRSLRQGNSGAACHVPGIEGRSAYAQRSPAQRHASQRKHAFGERSLRHNPPRPAPDERRRGLPGRVVPVPACCGRGAWRRASPGPSRSRKGGTLHACSGGKRPKARRMRSRVQRSPLKPSAPCGCGQAAPGSDRRRRVRVVARSCSKISQPRVSPSTGKGPRRACSSARVTPRGPASVTRNRYSPRGPASAGQATRRAGPAAGRTALPR